MVASANMHASSSRFLLGALALVLGGLAACTNPGGKVPVVSPISSFVAPEADEVFPEDEADGEADGEDGDFGGDEE